jgi:hypothetical protein
VDGWLLTWCGDVRDSRVLAGDCRVAIHAVHHPDFWSIELLSRACCWLSMLVAGSRGIQTQGTGDMGGWHVERWNWEVSEGLMRWQQPRMITLHLTSLHDHFITVLNTTILLNCFLHFRTTHSPLATWTRAKGCLLCILSFGIMNS